MAFCRNCGAELPENGKFCIKCGTPLRTDDAQQTDVQDMNVVSGQENSSAPEPDSYTAPEQESFTAPEQGSYTAPEQESFTGPEQGSYTAPEQNGFTATNQNGYAAPDMNGYAAPQGQYAAPQGGYGAPQKQALSPEEKKKRNKKIIIIAAIAVVAIAAIVAAILIVKNILDKKATERKTIDLSEYISVEFKGYDTKGEAVVRVDEDKFIEKALYAMKASEKNDKAVDKAEDLYDSIYVYVDYTYGLSNGDTIEVGANWDKDVVKKAGVILKFKEFEVEVSGLDKIKTVDPFEFADVQLSGVDGEVSVSVVNTSTEPGLSDIDFYVYGGYGLGLGDTFTVEASYDSYSLLNDYGISIENSEKEYTVDKVDTYDVSLEDITQEFLDELEEDVIDTINDDYTYSEYTISEKEYLGVYLLKAKDESTYPANRMFVVYKGKATNGNVSRDVYLPVEYDRVVLATDGTVYLGNDYGYISGYYDGLTGYVSEMKMFNEIVTHYSGEYDAYMTEGLRDYSEMTEKEDGSNAAEISYSYHYSDAMDALAEHGLFENIDQFDIADYVSSEDLPDDSEKSVEMMNIILQTLSKDEKATTDKIGPVPVDKAITWFYFDNSGLDYKLVYGLSEKEPDTKETEAAETEAADETAAEETEAE